MTTHVKNTLTNTNRVAAARFVYKVVDGSGDGGTIAEQVNQLATYGWLVHTFTPTHVLMWCDATDASPHDPDPVVVKRATTLKEIENPKV